MITVQPGLRCSSHRDVQDRAGFVDDRFVVPLR